MRNQTYIARSIERKRREKKEEKADGLGQNSKGHTKHKEEEEAYLF